jgi:cytoskeletal protein RodZ
VGTFGEKLRNRREQRGLSLDAISTTTKISPRMLRAIEDEHFDQLPGGVFNKGFVRAYARQIGLDEEEAISDYLAALGESQIQSQTILPNFRNSPDREADDREPGRRNANDNPAALPSKNKNNKNENKDKNNKDPHHHAKATVQGRPANGSASTSPPDRRVQSEDRRQQARRSQDREANLGQAPLSDLPPIEPPIDAASDNAPHNSRENDTANDVPYSYPSFLNLSSTPRSPHPSSQLHVEPPVSAPHAAYKNSLPRVPWIKLISALLLITLMLALWTIHRRSRSSAALQPQPSPQSQSAPVVPASAPTLPKPSATTSSLAARPSAAPTRRSPVSSAPPSQNPGSQNLHSQNLASTEPSTDSDVNPPVAKPHSHITAPAPARTFTLSIRANQTCWVSISTDGQPATTETLIAPANTSVHASREINVKAGNSAGISFLLNGHEVPIQGNAGEVRTFTFDSTGLRTSAPAQTTNLTR